MIIWDKSYRSLHQLLLKDPTKADLFAKFPVGNFTIPQNHIDASLPAMHHQDVTWCHLVFFVFKFDISTKLQNSWRLVAVVVDHLTFQETERLLVQHAEIEYRKTGTSSPLLFGISKLVILEIPDFEFRLWWNSITMFPSYYVMFPLILEMFFQKIIWNIPNIEKRCCHWRGSPAPKIDSKFKSSLESFFWTGWDQPKKNIPSLDTVCWSLQNINLERLFFPCFTGWIFAVLGPRWPCISTYLGIKSMQIATTQEVS